jgi:hypothetical protein
MEGLLNKRSQSEESLSSDGIQRPNKRCKIEQIVLSPFVSLSDDCLLLVLSYLPRDDLNSVAICSKRCREARTNDSLDQTRTGTITCTENTTLGSIIYAFFAQEWTAVFSGNRTRLKVVGLERMPTVGRPARLFPKYLLPNVSSLALSYNSLGRGSGICRLRKALAFPIMCPNLEEIDLSHTSNMPLDCVEEISRVCPNLRRLIWNASRSSISHDGASLAQTLKFMSTTRNFVQRILAFILPTVGILFCLNSVFSFNV